MWRRRCSIGQSIANSGWPNPNPFPKREGANATLSARLSGSPEFGAEFSPDLQQILICAFYAGCVPGKSGRYIRHYETCALISLDGAGQLIVRKSRIFSDKKSLAPRTDLFLGTWSPDGAKIAVQEILSPAKHRRLYIYDATGGPGRKVFTEP